MSDLRLVLRITGDGSGLKAEIDGANSKIDDLGKTGRRVGTDVAAGAREASQGVSGLTGTIVNAVAAAGGMATISGALLAIARAGDSATQSLAQLQQATGSLVRAREVYDALYKSSLQTGVAVADSAAAFTRFSIAAREIGATSDQVLRLVTGLQRAAIASNASREEVTSATLQLGQALASGVLQGDELRSVLEAMPALAEVLARELGVSIGEMRKLGSEGQLTADRVFPALIRATEQLGQRMEQAPLSMGRAMGQLTAATQGFLAKLDEATGLSTRIAQGLSTAANALERIRQGGGLLTDAERLAQRRVEVQQLGNELAQLEAGSTGGDELRAQVRRGVIRPGAVGAAAANSDIAYEQLLGITRQEYFRAVEELDSAERASTVARLDERERAERQAADARRTRSTTEINELRETLDRRLRIQRDAADREKAIAEGVESGAISPGVATALRTQSAQQLREDLDKLTDRPAGGANRADEGVASTLRDLRELNQEGRRITESVRTPLETLSDATARYSELLRAGVISQETYNRALSQAGEQYRRTLVPDEEFERNNRAFQELGRLGEAAFDNVGRSISQALVQGQFDFRDLNRVGLAVASELTQAFLKLAILNPLKNALTGGNATTLADVFSAVGGSYRSGTGAFYGSGPSTIDASGGGFLFHTGGVAGHDAAPFRAAPPALFSNAPRYHAGGAVGPDEVPAILRRGEGVFTPEQMARLSPAGGGGYNFAPTINFTGNAGSPEDRDALIQGMRALWLQDLRGSVPGIVTAAKGSLRQDVQRMGVDRALGAVA